MNSQTNKAKFILGYVSVPKSDIAKKIATILVNSKHAACVKILSGLTSFYMWEGSLQEENEFYILIKSQESKVPQIKEILDKEHPYKVYEFLYHEVTSANDKYSQWIESCLDDSSPIENNIV